MKSLKIITACILSVLFVFAAVIPAFADEYKTISEVRLTINEPKVGDAITKEIASSEPEKYTASVRYWIKQFDSQDSLDVFKDGGDYTVVIEITPASGYKFEAPQNTGTNNESPTKVYVNGKETRCVSWEEDNKLVRAYDAGVLTEDSSAEETNFFTRIINAIRDFFAGIADFFKNLFKTEA